LFVVEREPSFKLVVTFSLADDWFSTLIADASAKKGGGDTSGFAAADDEGGCFLPHAFEGVDGAINLARLLLSLLFLA
jgi:hypothetical protein